MKFFIPLLGCITIVSLTAFGQKDTFFEIIPETSTGVTFRNTLKETPKSNVLTYEYFYNGGGVAVGDVNNDGLEDIYLTGNMTPNALYLNMGNFKFKDITKSAGVACEKGWKTGVSMADINGDGLLDIYVCFSGKGDNAQRRNKLFINNGNLTFSEQAVQIGLADEGYTTHASFFDYDRDGDLDAFILNHNVGVIKSFQFEDAKKIRDPLAGDKLYRNDNGKFKDVSEEAGIKWSPLGFGLGVTVADVNQDGWADIYVSNDYVEPDYLYINNHDGTFTDKITDYVQHLSFFSMGSDISDINNDGWTDIYTLDMLPQDNKRQKLLYGPENYEHNAAMVENGFYFQNMRNMLHVNNANGTYSEIGQFSGISNTDWSWAPLLADFDNDGWKDLFVANGYYRDYTNQDFLKFKGNYYFKKARDNEKADTFALVTSISSTPLYKYIYKNNGDLTFTDKSEEWGFKTKKTFSSGCVYSDLDNDGDLDLVVSNLNEFASLHKNMTQERRLGNHYINISLKGAGKNTQAVGSKVLIYSQGKSQYFEKIPSKGFQSSVTQTIHAGVGNAQRIDSLKVIWPTGPETILKDVAVDQRLVVREEGTTQKGNGIARPTSTVFNRVETIVPYKHVEYGYNDFKRQPLLMTMLSVCGPVMATGDVNKDGLIDLYVGGTQENQGKLYLQNSKGQFDESKQFNFAEDFKATDGDALFFDADQDGDLDLYVASGGYHNYEENDPILQDRLYTNNGAGSFTRALAGTLPSMLSAKSSVIAKDFDGDGDTDIFLGGRVIPGKYPVSPKSFLLENKGDGSFVDVTIAKAPDLSEIGMVTDAAWIDVNQDKRPDLVVVGEFMAVEIFVNNGKTFEKATDRYLEGSPKGLWNKIAVHDFDKDGDDDMIIGNFGLNSQLKASEKEPVTMVYKDFDKNGSIDPIMTYYIEGKPYPFASRDEMLDQIYALRTKFTSYEKYATAQLEDVFTPEDLSDASRLSVTTLESIYLENVNGKLKVRSLPREAQFSPVHAIELIDYNKDGNMDVVLGGNVSSIRIRMGVIDANFGQLYQGDGNGNFTFVPQSASGLKITGDMKSLTSCEINNETYLLVGVNNYGVETYKVTKK